MKNKSKIHVFYSWQSDSPKKTNLNAIRKALQQACERLEGLNPKLGGVDKFTHPHSD
jgi:hypothetical protein